MSNSALIKQNGIIKAYGEIYTHDNLTAQEIPPGTNYTKLCPTQAIEGQVKNTILNTADCEIIITQPGLYNLVFTATSKIDVNQTILRTVLYKNETELENIHAKRVIKLPAEESTVQIEGFARLIAGDKISVRVRHDNVSAVNIITEYSNLKINRIDL